MWVLQITSSAERRWLRPGHAYTVGRDAACTFNFANDKSVSREHALITVQELAAENVFRQAARVTVEVEDKSKFGSFVNGRKITGKAALAEGDELRFGAFQATCRLLYIPVIICCSGMSANFKGELCNLLAKLDMRLLRSRNWDPNCTHLLMPKWTVTEKVVLALASAKPIVSMSWLSAVEDAGARQEAHFELPDAKHYLPEAPHRSVPLPLGEVDFSPDPRRSSVFSGKSFVAFAKSTFAKVDQLARAAGGSVLLCIPGETVADSADGISSYLARTSNVVPLGPYPKKVPPSVIAYLEKSRMRLVPETEVGYAILYVSAETFCNPSLDVQVGPHNMPLFGDSQNEAFGSQAGPIRNRDRHAEGSPVSRSVQSTVHSVEPAAPPPLEAPRDITAVSPLLTKAAATPAAGPSTATARFTALESNLYNLCAPTEANGLCARSAGEAATNGGSLRESEPEPPRILPGLVVIARPPEPRASAANGGDVAASAGRQSSSRFGAGSSGVSERFRRVYLDHFLDMGDDEEASDEPAPPPEGGGDDEVVIAAESQTRPVDHMAPEESPLSAENFPAGPGVDAPSEGKIDEEPEERPLARKRRTEAAAVVDEERRSEFTAGSNAAATASRGATGETRKRPRRRDAPVAEIDVASRVRTLRERKRKQEWDFLPFRPRGVADAADSDSDSGHDGSRLPQPDEHLVTVEIVPLVKRVIATAAPHADSARRRSGVVNFKVFRKAAYPGYDPPSEDGGEAVQRLPRYATCRVHVSGEAGDDAWFTEHRPPNKPVRVQWEEADDDGREEPEEESRHRETGRGKPPRGQKRATASAAAAAAAPLYRTANSICRSNRDSSSDDENHYFSLGATTKTRTRR